MPTQEDWQRLAELLIARRVELGFPRRAAFVRELGLSHPRNIEDVEKARRTNYDDSTIAQFDHLYQWAPGSVRRVLAGGQPTLIRARISEEQIAKDVGRYLQDRSHLTRSTGDEVDLASVETDRLLEEIARRLGQER